MRFRTRAATCTRRLKRWAYSTIADITNHSVVRQGSDSFVVGLPFDVTDKQPVSAVLGKRWGIKRLIKYAIVSLTMLALASALGWTKAVPRYRPGLRAGESYGLDVSHHQGVVDRKSVASNNIAFVYLKATEGGDHVDRNFSSNVIAVKNTNLRIGAYHFFTFCRSGLEQAANFLKVAPPKEEWLLPTVDVEFGGNCKTLPTEDKLVSELAIFINTVKAAWNRPVVIYVLYDVVNRYPRLGHLDAPIWQRHLFTRPTNNDWTIWQMSGFAHVDGVKGPVDLNIGKLALLQQ